jgi:hypothetical protein
VKAGLCNLFVSTLAPEHVPDTIYAKLDIASREVMKRPDYFVQPDFQALHWKSGKFDILGTKCASLCCATDGNRSAQPRRPESQAGCDVLLISSQIARVKTSTYGHLTTLLTCS